MASTWPTWYCISAIFVAHVYLSSVSASNTSCPTWFYLNATQQCECGKQVGGIRCNQQERKVEILRGYCVTYSGQEGLYYAGYCPFVIPTNNTKGMLSELPSEPDQLNNATCGPLNRKGLLCGRCINEHGPAVLSFNRICADCSEHSTGYAVTVYLALKLIPITVFFMCVLFFRLNITTGPLLGYVLFCQACIRYLQNQVYVYEYINTNVSGPTKILLQSSLTISDLWNLQYFRFVIPPLCLSTKLTGIHIQLLTVPTAIYPIVLVVTTCILMELYARNYRIIHILWKPISIPLKKINITSVTSDAVIHTFATFIFLSASSLSYTVYAIFNKTNVYQSINGTTYKFVLYFDPTITWFSSKHVPYIITGAIVIIFLLLIPSLLLGVYPTRMYGYLSQCISIRKRLAITAFTEALQSCFKDGLNGTRDYRALAALYLIGIPLLDILIVLVNYNNINAYLVSSLMCILSSFSISYLRPCKLTIANLSLSYHSMVLGILSVALVFWSQSTKITWILITAISISHILVLMWAGYKLTHWMMSRFRYKFNCKVKLTDLANAIKHHFHRRHGGYQVLPDTAAQ